MMKKTRRPVGVRAAALLLGVFLLTACGGTEAAVTVLSAPSAVLADAAAALPDFASASFVKSGEPDADLTLMFTYGIEEDAQLSAIADYALGVQTDPTDPRYFAVVRFQDGTDPAVIAAAAAAMEETFAAYIVGQTMRYASEKQAIAEGYTVRLYDNGAVMTAYDTSGNGAVFDAVDAACRDAADAS